MKNARAMHLLITVLFFGVILSCTAYFGITAMVASPDSLMDAPYRSEEELPLSMNGFDRGFYLDSTLRELLIRDDYRMFNMVADQSVLVGSENFLFPLTDGIDSDGYRYLEDYVGEAYFTEEELDRIAKSLAQRSIAYANQGTEYALVIIPNSQTVYGENLPSGIGHMGGQTRLEQLNRYLASHSRVTFLNLTEQMQSAKTRGQLYNNTENSLNALGAYTVYEAVLRALPAAYDGKYLPLSADEINIFTHYTVGKALARRAGVSALVKNKTLSLSNDTELKYQILDRIAGMEVTYVKSGYKDQIQNRPALLLEFGDAGEWDKIQMMPYFSNTFGTVAYKTNTAFSLMAVDYLSPAVAVQIIHENELDSLLDETLMLSYNDGLKPGDDPFTAMTPIVLGAAQSGADRICILGRCEQGSTIRLTGEGITRTEVRALGERFVLEAVFTDGYTSATVSMTAAVAGKAESEPEQMSLTLGRFVGLPQVAAGNNSMLFRIGMGARPYNSAYSQPQLRRIRERFVRRAEDFRVLSGKDTRLVYAYIPDKINIYGDALSSVKSDFYRQQRLSQLTGAFENDLASSVAVVNLTPPLYNTRTAGLLYRQTDSRLTPFGAFSAYRAVMKQLAAADYRLIPHDRGDYQLSEETVQGGDLVDLLGLEGASITESVTVLSPDFTSTVTLTAPDGKSVTDLSDVLVYRSADMTLPSAIVMRDAYGTQLLSYLAEHFSCLYVLEEDNFDLPDTLVREIAPDYIFELTSEYNLPLN